MIFPRFRLRGVHLYSFFPPLFLALALVAVTVLLLPFSGVGFIGVLDRLSGYLPREDRPALRAAFTGVVVLPGLAYPAVSRYKSEASGSFLSRFRFLLPAVWGGVLARLWIETGFKEQAVDLLEGVGERSHGSAEYWYNLGRAYLAVDRKGQAAACLDSLCRLGGQAGRRIAGESGPRPVNALNLA